MIEQLTFTSASDGKPKKQITAEDKMVLNKIISMLDKESFKLSNMKFRENAENTSYQSIVVNSTATPYRGATVDEITFARVKTTGKTQYIAFQAKYEQLFKSANIPYQKVKADDFIRIDLSVFDDNSMNCQTVPSILNKIFSSSFNFPTFGCCSKYVECSNAKKCIHEDKIYAKSCMYRKNLEQGKIFYGVNKNI